LSLCETPEQPILFHKFFERSLLDDAPFVDDQDLVGATNGA
jgi:hypothetical protein